MLNAYMVYFLFMGTLEQKVYSLYITSVPREIFACYSNRGSQKTMKQCLQNSERKLFSRIIYPAKLSIKSEGRRETFQTGKNLKNNVFQCTFSQEEREEAKKEKDM